jgi:hypothetical protein
VATATPFLDALLQVSAIASAKLPATLHGRLERATAIVLHGGVFFDDAGLCQVRASDDTTWYTVNGHCACGDLQAPEHLCKHRLARGLYLRATARLQEPSTTPSLEEPTASPAPRTAASMPEATFSITLKGTVRGRDALLTARGTTWAEFQAHLTQIEGLMETPAAPASPPSVPHGAQPTPDGWCVPHATPMKLNQGKDGRSWWSHKTAEGWCKGR